MALTTVVTLKFQTLFTDPADLSTPTDSLVQDYSINLATGTGAAQADMIFHDQRTLADAAVDTLDLYASGSLLDPLGVALTMAELKLLYIHNTSTTNSLTIGPHANAVDMFADNTSDIMIIPPEGKFLWTSPSAGGLDLTTDKNLVLTHDSTDANDLIYNIIVIGSDT